ncbi:MAG: CBS domain-containing protein [Flammeovirgaceae bacterium]
MGAKGVRIATSQNELNVFTRLLLKDIQALDKMLKEEWFEVDEIMIGAEQEMCLIDEHGRPAPIAVEILDKMNHPKFTTELARFNLEANLDPELFTGDCFSKFDHQIRGFIHALKEAANEFEVDPLLTGILPTIRKFDLGIENLTPIDRYYALIESIDKLRGEGHQLKIEGLDELSIKHTSALIEACNTSFQVHLQVTPDEFVNKYNIAQAIAAPVMAIASNSPMLFGKRLWSETRIALFQQSVDTRVTGEHLRDSSPRVTFGSKWLNGSILDLYKEDIVRFKTLLVTDVEEDVLKSMAKGITPKLKALNIHNSTVYRWNRPCYGISSSGKPHLRIENRILPAGPTVADELANAAFWLGLMIGYDDVYPDITKKMDFDNAKSNFLKAAKLGHGSKFYWTDGQLISDSELIEKELLPIARAGLEKKKVDQADIDKYLGIIEERNRYGRTGARWIVESYGQLIKEAGKEEAATALVAGILNYQRSEKPIHQWELAHIHDIKDWTPSSLLVEEFMTTDIFTVSKDDIPDLAADMMDWQQIRYLPIENSIGELIGLLTVRGVLRHFSALCRDKKSNEDVKIADMMITNPITIHPEATVLEAMDIMTENSIGCLPVVNNNKLVGMITEANFLNITNSLLKRLKRNRKKKGKN